MLAIAKRIARRGGGEARAVALQRLIKAGDIDLHQVKTRQFIGVVAEGFGIER